MKFAIVEDERIFVQQLEKVLKEWASTKENITISVFYTGEEIVKFFLKEQTEFDIIFMDIKLGGIDGMQTARQLREFQYKSAIVFTTHHTDLEFFQQSLDVFALQYFLKPVKVENIEFCVKRLNKDNKYTYTCNGKQIFVSQKEILYFVCDRNYINISTVNSDAALPKFRSSIATILTQLPQSFAQCHRSFIVNMTNIAVLEGKNLLMKNQLNVFIPIGDVYLDDLLYKFKNL